MSKFKYSLEIIVGDNRGAVYPLNRAATVIGSDTGADISLKNDTVAVNHCLLKLSQNRLTVIDMHSPAGTKIGTSKISSETVLNSGDIITVGSVQFRVLSSTYKERFVSLLPTGQDGEQPVIQKIKGLFKHRVKSTYEKITLQSLLLMAALAGLILVYPLYSSLDKQLKNSKVERAAALLKTLAAVNIDAMKSANQSMVDTSIIDKEIGVKMALVLTNQGVVWRPRSLLGKKANDKYGKNALKADNLLIQQRNDGLLDISMPIKYYDLSKGKLVKVGVARIFYDKKASAITEGINWVIILISGFIAYLLLAFLLAKRIMSSVRQDIHTFRGDCEDFIRNDDEVMTEKYSPEFNELTVTFNRMLRKSGPVGQSLVASNQLTDQESLFDLVRSMSQGAILLDAQNIVLASNQMASKILGVDDNLGEKKSFLEIPCRMDFYKDLLELLSNVAQSKVRKEIKFTLSSTSQMSCLGIPLAEDLTLLLFGVPDSTEL